MNLTVLSSQMHRPVVLLPVALALLAAAAAILWTNLARWDVAKSAGAGNAQRPVSAFSALLVSRNNIPRGQLLKPEDFIVSSVASADRPEGALSRAEDADGHMALQSIARGAPILKTAISDQAVMGLSARVANSYRAYAVPVSEANIAGGFIQAGDRVDLYVTLPGALFADTQAEPHNDHSKAALLLQSVEVLAVGAKLQSDGTPQPFVRTVTLAVSAADLPKMALATRLGTISFAIRNPADTQAAPASQAELASLVRNTQAAIPTPGVAPARARPGIPLYAGRDRTLVPVP